MKPAGAFEPKPGATNVNLLTDLEADRVRGLVAGGTEFSSAKAQAEREIRAVFGISASESATAEQLDISQASEDDAALLAISAIMQNTRSPAELTELLATMAADLALAALSITPRGRR